MAKLKIRTTVTFVANSTVSGEAVTKKDVAHIKREVTELLDKWMVYWDVQSAVYEATWGETTVRKPVITVAPVEASVEKGTK